MSLGSDQPRKLVIVGDSLFAEIAYEYFTHDSDYDVVAFAVERGFAKHEELNGLPVVDFEDLPSEYAPSEHAVYAALTYMQMNRLRTRLAGAAKTMGYPLASYISSNAFVWRNCEIGEHCFIFEDNTVQPFTRLEDNVVLWSGNHIGHHSTIRANCFISSHVVVSGSCDIGENCFIGVNSTLVNDISIGRDTWIGPHVTVTRDVEPASFLRPARSNLSDKSSFEVLGVDPDT
jgi:sugar O-acyltransferase (sialic acid O-acetyltransferase NeuD family)